jgi:hypothetical protein
MVPELRTQRLRDPVHGLIVFRKDDPLDQLAWALLDTPEFQRLRRIKQLGVSEFVFPSATHTRFAHCVGVFHTARELVRIIKREVGDRYDTMKAKVAIIAALLHDVGHGPFSHTFEGVQRSRGISKRHEEWTTEIIRRQAGGIRPLLDAYGKSQGLDFCEAVAALFETEDPKDIYHAVVSSSYDADRLDYLRRDRLMTGTGAGAIDFDWLMEHVRIGEISVDAPDPEGMGPRVPTFCFDSKALPAAEQFLMARFTLHEQVYLHKTTRCIEQMIAKLLRMVSDSARAPRTASLMTGLPDKHPLLRFFAKHGETPSNYLALDDVVVLGAVELMTRARDKRIRELAVRLRNRRLYKTLDIREFGQDDGKQRQAARRIDEAFAAKIKTEAVIKDEKASVSLYTPIGGDNDRTHKKLHILDGHQPREITEVSRVIKAQIRKAQFTRYYFENESDRDSARERGRS